ncbi:hypothetical protein GCM10010170_048310 [Dactylosporangium salmoneum]|uniref:Uncharacterized protein n=1 Tax=Dactylosporangium salmoneum TaxID=53361 RepID=A0ABN3GMW3_9ACTN
MTRLRAALTGAADLVEPQLDIARLETVEPLLAETGHQVAAGDATTHAKSSHTPQPSATMPARPATIAATLPKSRHVMRRYHRGRGTGSRSVTLMAKWPSDSGQGRP